MAWTSLCERGELTEGRGKYVEIGGFKLAVFLHGGAVYVLDSYCPHAGGNLAGGHVEDGCAVCPWHHWAFHLDTGQMATYSRITVNTYKTRLLQREGQADLVQADLPIY